jgi:hypothetical protein
LPRGSGDRLPWQFGADAHLGIGWNLGKERTITASVDIFNLFNFQAETARDQRYTVDKAVPIPGGSRDQLGEIRNLNGDLVTKWPNFGNPVAYQEPRQFRFGLRTTF